MRQITKEEGFIKPLLVILILVFLCYSGYQFGMPYYRYSALKADARELARVSLGQAQKCRDRIYDRAKELNVPVTYDDIYVERRLKRMFVSIYWSEEVDILGIYQKKLNFSINFDE